MTETAHAEGQPTTDQGSPQPFPPSRSRSSLVDENGRSHLDRPLKLSTRDLVWMCAFLGAIAIAFWDVKQGVRDVTRELRFERRYNDLRGGYQDEMIGSFEHNFGIMTAYTVSLREKMIEAGIQVNDLPKLRRVPKPVRLLEMEAERDMREEEN